MPAYAQRRSGSRAQERVCALAGVAAVQLLLGWALLSGLHVRVGAPAEIVDRLISVTLQPPPAPIEPAAQAKPSPVDRSSAPKAEPKPLGGSPGSQPAHAQPSVAPIVAIHPAVAPSGGGSGTGPALGSGAGGGTGGAGYRSGDGGTDLEQIAGDITPRDYPRRLARAGIGGTVRMRCTVGVNGRVTRCILTRSSGVPELDALTPRLIEQRFVYRPATDRQGRPVPDDVEIDWTWD